MKLAPVSLVPCSWQATPGAGQGVAVGVGPVQVLLDEVRVAQVDDRRRAPVSPVPVHPRIVSHSTGRSRADHRAAPHRVR